MKKELTNAQRAEIERWAKDLDSGKYPQALSALHDDVGYCCLGVYAEVCGAKWQQYGEVDETNTPYIDGKKVGGVGGDEYLVDNWLLERTGIDHKGQEILACANDAEGSSFADIAKGLRAFASTGEWPKEWIERYRR